MTVADKIQALRRTWGSRLLVLGHHYQTDEVLRHVDERGDSLELARKAASHRAERIVFCGVRFMAESADILTEQAQAVYMPVETAGCSMANMASPAAVEKVFSELDRISHDWLPVAYVNTTAGVKAVCGRNGGTTCTSGNAERVFKWVFSQGKRVFFLPDEHLGTNTAHDLGIPDRAVRPVNPADPSSVRRIVQEHDPQVLVWPGFCSVHTAFTRDHVYSARKEIPDATIIVHPEAPKEVVRLCEAHGSTSGIIDYVEHAEAGSTVFVGTELNLVRRLTDQHRGRVMVKPLAASVCRDMSATAERDVLDLFENWRDERRVVVPRDVARDARTALQTMLEI